MVNKAWSLPNLHDQKINQKENNKWVGVASSTTSQDLVESSSTIRQELIQSTGFLLHVQLPCVSVNLSKKDCGQLNRLLDLILDGLSDVATGSPENGKDKSSEIFIQTSVIFECSMLDICTELDEAVEVGPSLQTELEGSWNRLKLSVSKLSLCSFSNVGGVNNASFLWVNHGEGELWGSISGTDDQTCEGSRDFLLVICKDSASQRGDGEGNNVLSFGAAGCSVTHIRNPKLQENYTSVNVRSGTLVAPGGRMDWISAISLLFSSGSSRTEQSNDSSPNNSQAGEPFWSSFFLELADVALSYEPHLKNSIFNAEAPDCKFYSCLLAASSFKLHNKSASDSAATDFDIQLRDLGLLICGSSGSKNATCGYDVDYLHQMGYAKIGHNTFIEAALRIDSSFWELEISESQFDIGTCRDTTYGLVRLVSQLQKLYAPDMRDALVHLQSRWNIVQQANTQNMASDASDVSESSTDNLTDSGECKSDGLLEDIIENAFYTDQAYTAYNFWDRNCHNSLSSSEVNAEYEMNMANPETTDVCVSHISLGSSLVTPEANTAQTPLKQNSCPEQIIDSYYMPDLLNSSSSAPYNVIHQCTSGDDARKAMDCDDGGWYSNTPLMIVENHVSKRNNPHGEPLIQQEGNHAIRTLNSEESCNLKGKICIHDIDVKWRMYAGDDWLLAQNDSTTLPCSNGRDRSSSLEFIVSGLSMQFDMYPDGDVSVSKLSISAQDLNLCDQNTHAPWKMVHIFG
jgi:autophagy-related protein 2